METEKILTKIKNLFELSKNNSNENEAIAAALKAQELMAKYNIEVEQLNTQVNREIVREVCAKTDKHVMKKWRLGLGWIIAENFRCKIFMVNKMDLVFLGYKEDAKIAKQTFEFLLETGNRFAIRYYNRCRKEGRSTKGVMNTYLAGFRQGVKEALEAQCRALMIITPQEVITKYEELTKGNRPVSTRITINGRTDAYYTGRDEGHDFMSQKLLSAN